MLATLSRAALALSGLLIATNVVAATTSAAVRTAERADGPVFSRAEMERGTTLSARECAAFKSTVFVVAQGTGLCFRYYLSKEGGDGPQAVFYLSGDKGGEALVFDPAALGRDAASLSKIYRMPTVYLARMGIDGSSGRHNLRRTRLEVDATNLAIQAIKARHGFTTINVMGQSGGAHLTGALVGLRDDIACAVPGSGRLAFTPDYAADQARVSPERRHYDPVSALPAIVRHSAKTRILVVTDPGDERVPAASQTGFVRQVLRAGGRIAQFYVTATDPLSHGVQLYTARAMLGCLAGTPDAEIGAGLARLSELRFRAQLPAGPRPGADPQARRGAIVQARAEIPSRDAAVARKEAAKAGR